jgi:ATP-dependent helicase HrpA
MLNPEGGGDVLVFLPGFREIRQAKDELVWMRPHLGPDIAILHGRLPPDEKRGLLAASPAPSHRIILTTNVG